MRYLLLICTDGVPTPEKRAVMPTATEAWVEEMDGRGVRLWGDQLASLDTAVTVRTRGGETFVSDGPFVESKEFLAGIDIIDCADLDEAIAVAAKHPVSWFDTVEVRPLKEPKGEHATIEQQPPVGYETEPGRCRYLMLMYVNGIAEPPEEEQAAQRNGAAWVRRLQGDDAWVYGCGLAGADAATTVRVRDGETLLSDGPFVEAKEFIGGFAIVDCHSREEAIAYAGAHPLAHYHHVEVRPFIED